MIGPTYLPSGSAFGLQSSGGALGANLGRAQRQRELRARLQAAEPNIARKMTNFGGGAPGQWDALFGALQEQGVEDVNAGLAPLGSSAFAGDRPAILQRGEEVTDPGPGGITHRSRLQRPETLALLKALRDQTDQAQLRSYGGLVR